MRVVPLIAVLLLSASVAGCAESRAATAELSPVTFDVSAAFGNYLSARFAAEHHDLQDAARYFEASLRQDPDNPQLLTYAFFYLAEAGHVDQAAKYAQRIAAIVPGDRTARLTLAVDALHRKDFGEARAQIAKSEKGPFSSFTDALIDAWAAAGTGDTKAAAADLKLLHSQHSADGLAYYNEATLAELLGRRDEAEAAYKKALESSGPTPRVIDAYGRFLEHNGRTTDARTLYTKIKAIGGLSPVAEAGLARIASGIMPAPLVTDGAQGAAEALFGIAASLNDDSSRDVSVLYLRLALYLRPDLDLAQLLLADRFESIERYADAIAVYDGISKESPYYRMAGVQAAVDQGRQGNLDGSIKDLLALTGESPGDIEAWTALGDAYREAKKPAEAAKAYDRAIAANDTPTSKSWPLFFARAVALQQSNNWKAAEADLKTALKLSPNEPQVLNYLGYSWVDQRQHVPEALQMLEKARSLAPQDGYIVDSVGWAYYRLGRYGDAAKTLENAILLVPGDPTINDHFGDALWKVGRKREARFQWSHALAFGADGGEKQKIEKKLQVGLSGDDRS